MVYLNCFFFYSILGFLLETGVAFITKSNFESGILYGPWTPIYGIGTVVILLLSHYFFMNLHLPRWIETIIVFFIIAIFLSCLELIGGIIIERIFHVTFWSYENHRFAIGNYISLEMAFVWGIASILFIYIIHPLFKTFLLHIPSFIPIFLSICMVADFLATFVIKLKK